MKFKQRVFCDFCHLNHLWLRQKLWSKSAQLPLNKYTECQGFYLLGTHSWLDEILIYKHLTYRQTLTFYISTYYLTISHFNFLYSRAVDVAHELYQTNYSAKSWFNQRDQLNIFQLIFRGSIHRRLQR